jgi:alpha-tubulin suppressor-like RCC1 family protein
MQVGTSNAWIQVSAGGYHSLGIQRDYTTWAWGFNAYSQCGTSGGIVTVPTQIVDENANTFYSISLAAGQIQSLAVSTTNELYAWGNNTYGQLGTGDVSERGNPSKIGSLTTWQSVSSRGLSSGGILTDNSLYVWGYNGTYNLGLGDLANRSSPVKLGASNWQEISLGLYHSAAIRYDGSLWSWGFNGNGEIGNNTSGLAAGVTTPIQITSLNNWKRVSVGGNPIDVLHPTNGNVNIAPQGYTVSIAVATDF